MKWELQVGVPSADMLLLGLPRTLSRRAPIIRFLGKIRTSADAAGGSGCQSMAKGILPFLDSQKKLISLVLEIN